MRRHCKILIAANVARGRDRQVCRGLYKYLNGVGGCETMVIDPSLQPVRKTADSWRADAVLGIFDREDDVESVARIGQPVVRIFGGKPRDEHALQVGTCERQTAELGAHHLASLGFERFGYVGTENPSTDQTCQDAFYRYLRTKRKTKVNQLTAFTPSEPPPPPQNQNEVANYLRSLERWLYQVEKPVAIFACDTLRARWVWTVCRHCGWRIPEDVAILGVHEDFILTQQAAPDISVVETPSLREGYLAGEMIDRTLQGMTLDSHHIFLPPVGILGRGSTEILIVDDDVTRKALAFIRRKACQGIRVEDVCLEVGLSRRVLEKRFRAAIDSSPAREIRRIQIRQVEALLRETDLTTDAIAVATALTNKNRLAMEFRKQTGLTPTQYRRAHASP